MKKVLSLLILVFFTSTYVFTISTLAVSPSATFTGPSTVRSGDTITLTFKVNGTNLYGGSGTLNFNESQLSLTKTTQKIASPWLVEFSGKNFLFYDNNQTSPISSNTTIFILDFKVKSLDVGTNISISLSNLKTTDKNTESSLSNSIYTVKTVAPLSANAKLSSLIISDGILSPSFNSSITSYTALVDFDVEQLKITAKAQDDDSIVVVTSPSLKVDAVTNVSVKVTAQSGSTNTYTIKVTRSKDPNYVPQSNNDLASLMVEGFLVSPQFDPSITSYIVWLPFETEAINISTVPDDGKASVVVNGGSDLQSGKDNIINVVCTSENGTIKTYVVIAKRADSHENLQNVSSDSSEEVSNVSSVIVADEQISTAVPTAYNHLHILIVIPICILCAITGFLCCYLIFKRVV